MRALWSTLILPVILPAAVLSQQQGYQSKYANIDVDAILSNQRILKSYINCFLDQRPCTPQGREGKKYFPEIYKSNCSKCSDDQKLLLKKTIKAFYSKRKDDWDKIVDKYDPKHEKEEDFLKWINEN